MVNKKTKILFLTQTNEHGAASRYRVYQYLEYLRSSGFIPVVSSGLPGFLFGFFYKRSNILKKLICLPLIIIKRIADLSRVRKFDIVFIQRDIIPHCYPLFEMLISRMNKNIVFDFDDAIFTANPENSRFLKKIRYKKAVERIIKKSRAVIAGNDFLRQYALKFNKNVYLLPTSVDTQRWNSKTEYPDRKEGLIIGWIGQEYTLFYLDFLKPVFKRLSSEFDFCLHIVGAGFDYGIEGVRIKNISWDYSSEVDLVREFDVGVAPLSDDEWARGKCGLKALLYMACGVPCVCSDAGVFKDIITDNSDGFLAAGQEQWYEKIASLLKNKELRMRIGKGAVCTVREKYSVQKNREKLKDIIESIQINKNLTGKRR